MGRRGPATLDEVTWTLPQAGGRAGRLSSPPGDLPPGAPPKARSSLTAEGWENQGRSHAVWGRGTRGNGGATLDGIWCGAPRRCLGPPGWGRPLRAEGCRVPAGLRAAGSRERLSGRAREGRGRERRFPDRVGRLGSRGTDGRCLSGSGQCPSSPRLPSKPSGKVICRSLVL